VARQAIRRDTGRCTGTCIASAHVSLLQFLFASGTLLAVLYILGVLRAVPRLKSESAAGLFVISSRVAAWFVFGIGKQNLFAPTAGPSLIHACRMLPYSHHALLPGTARFPWGYWIVAQAYNPDTIPTILQYFQDACNGPMHSSSAGSIVDTARYVY
jgi:hypothetical protein